MYLQQIRRFRTGTTRRGYRGGKVSRGLKAQERHQYMRPSPASVSCRRTTGARPDRWRRERTATCIG